jgi:MFS superfamily sulfate permease-like transporter
MYFLFGTSRDLTVGPTSILSLIVATEASKDENGMTNVGDAVFLSFYAGLIELAAGFLHLGM